MRTGFEPGKQRIRRPDRASADQPARKQQSSGGCGFASRERGRVAESPPAVGAGSAAPPVAAQREPVVRVHVDVGALEPAHEPGMQMHEADDVEAVVFERRF